MAAAPTTATQPTQRLTLPRLSYHGMRLLRFRLALRAFFKRWAVFMAMAVVLASIGSNAPLSVALALASLLFAPLVWAQPHTWAVLPVLALYSAAGWLAVALTQALWWPGRWRLAEAALPVPDAERRRSDLKMALLLSLPLHAVLLLGAATLAWQGGAAQVAQHLSALLAWAASAALGLCLALGWMQQARQRRSALGAHSLRRAVRHLARLTAARDVAASGAARAARAAVWRRPALWLLLSPLWRGRAPQTLWALMTSALALLLCLAAVAALALMATRAGAANRVVPGLGWPLAAVALGSFVATSQLRVRSALELLPLWQQARHLPVPPHRFKQARALLLGLPATLALLGLPLVLAGVLIWQAPGAVVAQGAQAVQMAPVAQTSLRLAVLAAYLLALALGCLLEAATQAGDDAGNRAARWLFMLVLTVALGTEVGR